MSPAPPGTPAGEVPDTTPSDLPVPPPDTVMVDLSLADAERIMALEHVVWFEIAPGVSAQDGLAELDFGRTRGAEPAAPVPRLGAAPEAGTPLAGMYASWRMAVTAPGPRGSLVRLPMNGLTWVGVHPDLRRRGILRQMMTEHLTAAHDEGEAVAGLQAAEVGIYGRFGYGAASLDVTLTLGRGSSLEAAPEVQTAAEQVTTHFVPAGTPQAMEVIQRAHLAAAEHTLGAVTRTDAMASVWFRDFPVARGSKEPWQVLFGTRGDDVCGYAVFRRAAKWEHGVPGGEVTVSEMGATDPGALLALARRLVDFDLTGTVTLHGRGIDDPLLWWAGGPRATALRAGDSLWVRLVDVDKALTARGYNAPVDVVLDVLDPVCPWNQRRWRLTVDPDGVGRCLPTEDAPELRLPVAALGAAYLGSRPVAGQVAAGTVTELRPGAAAELSRAMRADVEPIAAIGF